VTAGGMHGTVAGIDEKDPVDPGLGHVKAEVRRSAVNTIIREGESAEKS